MSFPPGSWCWVLSARLRGDTVKAVAGLQAAIDRGYIVLVEIALNQ